MNNEDRFKAILEADATILGYLTGGVYTFTELGRDGLVHTNNVCAGAFQLQYGIPTIRPCVVIRIRTDTPTYVRHDGDTQQTSYDGVVEFWFYQFDDYDQIDLAADRLYTLLSSRVFAGLGYVRPLPAQPRLIAPEFENTSLRREDYQFRRVKRI